jgi:nucleoside phosphorylase
MYYSLPAGIRSLFSAESLGLRELAGLPTHKKLHKNVGIVTIIKPELDAVLLGLGRGVQDPEDERRGPFRYWYDEIERPEKPPLSVVVTMVGRARNVPCAIAVNQLLNLFTFDLLMLVGIAAGPKGEVKLGDVVAAERVYDYEHVRSELIKEKIIEKQRPLFVDIPDNIQNDLAIYNDQLMKVLFNHLLKSVSKKKLPYRKVNRRRVPYSLSELKSSFHRGTVTAGERLFADGRLKEMVTNFDQRIRAGDQEDSGFAQVCKANNVQWCVFRGIADYGDPRKNDGWHVTASIAAASASLTFLKYTYQLPSDISF